MKCSTVIALIAATAQILSQQGVPVRAASITDLGKVSPCSINNTSQVLVVVKPTGELAIWQLGKLTRTGIISPNSTINLNDSGHFLVNGNRYKGVQTTVYQWDGVHAHKMRSLPFDFGAHLTNNEEILVVDKRGDGLYHNGTVRWFIKPKHNYVIQATSVNDRHQFVGVFMGPMTKDKSKPNAFSAHAFVWDHGVFQSLKSLGNGYLYPFSINNRGQVVGEFRPAHLGMEDAGRVAIFWPSPTSRPIGLNTLLPKDSPWKLEAADGINDRGEIIGIGTHGGKRTAFLLSAPEAVH